MPTTERRLVPLALLAAFVLPALAPSAAAQTEADLQVVSISAGSPRYLVPTTIQVVIENRGGLDMAGGWQFFLGWGGVGDRDCVNDADPVVGVNGNKPCYYRYSPTNKTLAPGDRITLQVPWKPAGAQRGDGQLYGHIAPLGNVQSRDQASSPPRIPGESSANNVRAFHVTVHSPVVVAVPDRAVPPGGSGPNDLWDWEEITQECRPAPEVTTHGCRATPGAEARFAFNVTNQGTLADSYTGVIVYGSDALRDELSAKGYRFTLSPQPVSVPRGATQTVHLSVFVPEKELHNKGINLNATLETARKLHVRWHSSVNTDVHTDNDAHCGACSDPTLPSLYAGIRRAMNATTNESAKPVKPTETVTFNVRVENTGNHDDNYTLEILPGSAVNGSWRPRLEGPGVLAAGEARNATIDLAAPDDAPKGLYPVHVRVRSQGDATGAAVANFTFVADLQQRWGVISSLLPTSSQVAPGEKATYALTVTNTGNGPDNATLALGNVPTGWSVALSEDVARLEPFGARRILLNVTPPPGTAAGAEAHVKINVTSEGANGPPGSPREKALEATASLTVLSRPNADVTLEGPAKRFVDAGDATDWLLHVRNVGNLASNFTVGLDNPDPAWVATATPSSLVLDPLASGTVRVSLRAPGDSVVGETNRVIATIRSTVDPTRFDQETLVGAVSGPDLAVKALLANTSAPYSGDPLALDVVVANEGNKAPGRNVTLRVLFIQAGVERVIDELDYASSDLPGGRRLSARVVWDTSGVEGPGVLVARIDPANAIPEIDDGSASNEASLALVLRTFDVTITPAEGLAGRPGEKVTYGERPHLFLLRHRGNQPTEAVRVLVESEHGWIDPEKATLSLDLPRDAEVPVPIDVLIPREPGAARDALRVTLVPQLRPGSAISAATLTRVIDEEPPRIVRVGATPAHAGLGENVTLEAFVRDATGVSSVTAHLVSPANDTTAIPMAHAGGDRWALRQTFSAAGTWRVFVEARDNADPPNAHVARDELVPFTIDPGSAPLIKLADGQPTTIRSGTPVKLNITDPLGVAKARYVIRGIAYDMPRPHQIDTSAFPAGLVEVLVEAENVYGARGTARFNLTVDNTPPAIRKVTLSPESPKANEDALLTIETDGKVDRVEVLLRKDGRVAETREATRKAAGLFELLLNPGEGDYVLDVSARDAAGNVKLEEGVIKFSAKPKSPFDVPAPPAWLLLGALLAATLLAGRRRRP